MIDLKKCTECTLTFEVLWDDTTEIYSAEVEDTDRDPTDFDDDPFPIYCPFCGIHIGYDGGDVDDD